MPKFVNRVYDKNMMRYIQCEMFGLLIIKKISKNKRSNGIFINMLYQNEAKNKKKTHDGKN